MFDNYRLSSPMFQRRQKLLILQNAYWMLLFGIHFTHLFIFYSIVEALIEQ